MFETFKATVSPMLVMFLCMVIGFILNKKRLAPQNTATVLSKIENYICVPALVFNTFMSRCTPESLAKNYPILIYSLIALAAALIIAYLLSPLFARNDSYQQNIYKYALTFGNFGFMGNAIVPVILSYDPDILYKFMLFTLPLQTAVYTWGILILIPRKEAKQHPLKNLINPTFFAIVLGIFFGLSGFGKYIPGFAARTIDYCQDCMAPLAMMLTGFVIGGYKMNELLCKKRIYVVTLLRLLILPTAILALLYFLGASALIITLALFAYATPLGMNTVVFPAAYGGDTKTGASMAMISHALCVITIPVMYTVLTVLI